MTVCKSN